MARRLVGMNEAHPGIEFSAPLIFLKGLVIFSGIREVVNGSDSMNQVIERALQGKPVIVFRLRPELPRFECLHPTRHGRVLVNILVGRQPAKGAF